jgi:hypothetical protein
VTILCLAAPFFGFLLLAAHFFRGGNYVAMLVCILMIALFFVRRPWCVRTLQVALLLGALEWLRTTVQLVGARSEAGEPFLRLAFILGGVALFTALSTLVFQTSRIKRRFGLQTPGNPNDAGIDSSKN